MYRVRFWIALCLIYHIACHAAYPQPDTAKEDIVPPTAVVAEVPSPLYDRTNVETFKSDLAAAETFSALRALRDRLLFAIDSLKGEEEQLERRVYSLPSEQDMEALLQTARQNLDYALAMEKRCKDESNCPGPPPTLGSSFFPIPPGFGSEYQKTAIKNIERDIGLISEIGKEVALIGEKVFELEQVLSELDRKINDFLARDIVTQEFKSNVSLYFTAIVGLMIVAFFALLFYDPQVRSSIFSTPSAIQFITLFSLVIAIILFGITEILESRELSALLGGLSGYILGRYSSDDVKK